MLNHADIWRAIDRLAESHGLTPSGLARLAGLSATSFNLSKRRQKDRDRWPSTESIAAILNATQMNLESFISLTKHETPIPTALPLYTITALTQKASGPTPSKSPKTDAPPDHIPYPGHDDPQAYIVAITHNTFRPLYREGDQILVSPAAQIRRGDPVIVKTRADEIFIRPLGLDGAQKIELLPSSPDDSPLTLPRKEIEWIHRITWSTSRNATKHA